MRGHIRSRKPNSIVFCCVSTSDTRAATTSGLFWRGGSIEQVHVTEPIGRYVVDVVTGTRTSQRVQVGASPRGSLALLKLSRCRAVLEGRDFVTPEDVKAVAGPALSHRLMLRPELWVQRIRPEDVVREVLETVPTPAAEGLPAR
jgi:MoxR-like ATPase